MTIRSRVLVTIICVVSVLTSAIAVGAQATQEKKPKPDVEVVTIQSGSGHGVGVGVGHEPGGFAFSTGGQGDSTFVFVSTEMSIDGKVVKGAPYSAQAVTETVQTLADGNRIVRRSSSAIYRDSDGRTRREQTINAVGAYATSSDAPQTIFINDPVAGVNYILETKSRTARKIDLSNLTVMKKRSPEGAKSNSAEAGTQQKHEAMMKAEIAASMPGPRGGPMPFEHSMSRMEINSTNSKKESLGTQTIEGVSAEGTRFTHTIAAGEIGNDAPINVVSESWYSPELQTVVMSKHSDPRMGEHTYRLTNISRSEPARSLFELPSDYTVKESIEPNVRLKIENEIKRAKEKQEQ